MRRERQEGLADRCAAAAARVRRGDVAEILHKDDAGWLQGIGDGKMGFSRFIGTAPPSAMLQNRKLYGAADFPPILHDGIEEVFAEEGSVVHSLDDGTWHRFLAGD